MAFSIRQTGHTLHLAILCAAVVSFLGADTALAQRPAGGHRPTRPGPRQPQRPVRDAQREELPPAPGAQEGWILRYKPADDEAKKEDPELIGTLKVKPYGKHTTVLSLLVKRSDELRIMIGEHEVELDELDKYIHKRMHVMANWDFLDPGSKRDDKFKKKVLRSLTFKTTEVDGEVEEILDGGRLVVSGVPANDQQWPDYVPDDSTNNTPAKPEKPVKKKLKLVVIDDMTKFFTKDTEEADLSDFKVGDKVRVTVVYAATKPGYVLKMRPPGVDEVTTPQGEPDRGGRPGPQGPRPQPRGRGRAVPQG